jgi:oligoribonuclease (3'-5' exoribonuclease)
MIYVSIDTETTGLDNENCQLLEIGAVIEDTENQLPLNKIPKFHCIVIQEYIIGQPYALNMNKNTIEILARFNNANCEEKEKIRLEVLNNLGVQMYHPYEIPIKFAEFLLQNNYNPDKSIIVAGKNYEAFDKGFLNELPNWNEKFSIHRRVLDPATSFTKSTDIVPPNLQTCLKRCGIIKEISHDALEDAYDVVQVLRHVIK